MNKLVVQEESRIIWKTMWGTKIISKTCQSKYTSDMHYVKGHNNPRSVIF